MTCYEIKMSQFLKWYLEEEPQPSDWENLYAEYISLRENKSSQFIVNLIKEIAYLKAKYQIVETCCRMLPICFDNKLVSEAETLKDELRKYNYRFAFDMANEKTFSANIRAVLTGNKKNISLWERKEKELKDYQEKHNSKAWTRKDFYVWAITLGEHQKQRVDLEIVSVAEWCIMMNRYEQYCEIVNAQQKGKKYGQR